MSLKQQFKEETVEIMGMWEKDGNVKGKMKRLIVPNYSFIHSHTLMK